MAANAHVTVRRATAADVDAVLDLLIEYDLPRRHFEPQYLSDPTYRPTDSWLLEEDGRLAAHLRVFDRTILVSGTGMRVAGIGNVITRRLHRGRGHASRLLQTALGALPGEGYAYSLLGTDIPDLYRRFGWVPITQWAVSATLGRVTPWRGEIKRFALDDLPVVANLYATDNARRTGPTVRDVAYWRGQLAWLDAEPEMFLVARTSDGTLAGYVRVDRSEGPTHVLELILRTELEVGRALLSRVAERRGRVFQTHLPCSRLDVFYPDERALVGESGLMGRVLNVQSFVETVQPIWAQRLQDAGVPGARIRLDTSAGSRELNMGDGSLMLPPLKEEQLADLLFHGRDQTAGDIRDILFPAQDFVLWPADDF